MDDQNKGVNERWSPGEPSSAPREYSGRRDDRGERGYATEEDRNGDDARRTAELRSEIDRTRADMSETVGAIQERLRPSNVVANAAGSVREAAAEKFRDFTGRGPGSWNTRSYGYERGNSVMDRIRERPIPAAIAAASLAWLFLGKRSSSNYPDSRSLNAGQWPSPRYGSVSSDVNPEPGAGWDYTEEPFASASTGVREASRPDAAAERIRRATATAQQQVRRVAHENTMVAGAAAAVLGLAIGFLLPETERENEMMGEARDSVVDRAKDAARGAAERVKETAEEVQRVATDAITATGSKSQPGTGQS